MSGIRSHHLAVERTARVVTLAGPEPAPSTGMEAPPSSATEAPAGGPAEAWVVCHGYRQLAASFIGRFTGIANDSRLIVAPEGLSRFYVDRSPGRHGPESRVGATWMTREDRDAEIADYVAYLDRVAQEFTEDAESRVALGFSQGVHTVARWIAMGSTAVDRVVFWGAYLPPDLDLVEHRDRLAAVELIQVHGEVDRHRSPDLERVQDERLETAGLSLRKLYHPGGHELDSDVLQSLVLRR